MIKLKFPTIWHLLIVLYFCRSHKSFHKETSPDDGIIEENLLSHVILSLLFLIILIIQYLDYQSFIHSYFGSIYTVNSDRTVVPK